MKAPALINIHELTKLTSLSKTSLYNLMGRNEFPKPVKVTARRVAWRSEQVAQWIESRQ